MLGSAELQDGTFKDCKILVVRELILANTIYQEAINFSTGI